jgi:hypothetical protein
MMLGVEGGNVDMFIFSLVAGALLLARRGTPSAIVSAPLVTAATLKLFLAPPFASLCLNQRGSEGVLQWPFWLFCSVLTPSGFVMI